MAIQKLEVDGVNGMSRVYSIGEKSEISSIKETGTEQLPCFKITWVDGEETIINCNNLVSWTTKESP